MKVIATQVDDGNTRLARKIGAHHDGRAMDNYFYRSHLIYQREQAQIFGRCWLYAGHVSQIPKANDFFLFEFGEDSMIVARTRESEVRAFANVCRHRGARVCEAPSGNAPVFVCPYHAWSYASDGALLSARHMQMRQDFDKADYGLVQVRAEVHEGLIFINLDADAPALAPHVKALTPALRPYRLDQAKLAYEHTFQVDANWKFALENYLECYHCGPSHQVYAQGHSLAEVDANVADLQEAMFARSRQATGLDSLDLFVDHAYDKTAAFGCETYTCRYALYDGHLTGSKDGQPVAPLMGDFKGYDGGTTDFQIGPITFTLNYPDHVVLYRFVPRGLTRTDMLVQWFVDGNAVPTRDYDRDALSWLWLHTSKEDEYIILRNAEGANSRFFEPGPLHPEFEEQQNRFIRWYLQALTRNGHC